MLLVALGELMFLVCFNLGVAFATVFFFWPPFLFWVTSVFAIYFSLFSMPPNTFVNVSSKKVLQVWRITQFNGRK